MNRRTPKVRSGDEKVDRWLATKALQHPEKHLSVTKVLLDEAGANCEMENNYLPDSTFRASRHAPSATDTGRRANMTSVFALSPPPTIIK